MSTAAAATAPSALTRIWHAYLHKLKTRPYRTKMITSGALFLLGDTVAQFGIESRQVGGTGNEEDPENTEPLPYDPWRAFRLSFYGTFIFAPLAHNWLLLVEKLKYPNKYATAAARVAADQLLWGPFVVTVFWVSNGLLEGKTFEQCREKLRMAFLPVYTKSLLVFTPTASINFLFVPIQHRMTVAQTVGLGWNSYLSYQNNLNNKRLAAANVALAAARDKEAREEALEAALEARDAALARLRAEDAVFGTGTAWKEVDSSAKMSLSAKQAHEEVRKAHAEVEAAEHAVAQAKAKMDKIRRGEGGGSTAVGTRMGY